MNETEEAILLGKYISGELSDFEIAKVNKWIDSHPERGERFIHLYEAWHASLVVKHDLIDVNRGYDRFLYRLKSIKDE